MDLNDTETIRLNALDGADTIIVTLTASGLAVTGTLLPGNGDNGGDILVGSDGNDTLNSGRAVWSSVNEPTNLNVCSESEAAHQ